MPDSDTANVLVPDLSTSIKSVQDLKAAIGNEKALEDGLLLLVRTAESSRFVVLRP